MAKYLFINGRPGSGKSSIARAIAYWYRRASNVVVLNDYHFLWKMFMDEQSRKVDMPQFQRREQSGAIGFDVRDRQVFPRSLSLLSEQAGQYLTEPKLVLIEFARKSYYDVCNCFSTDIMKDAQFLFMQAPLGSCIKRIEQRVDRNLYPDDKPVSEDVMHQHYQEDGLSSLLDTWGSARVHVLNNARARSDVWLEARRYLDAMVYQVASPAVWSIGDFKPL